MHIYPPAFFDLVCRCASTVNAGLICGANVLKIVRQALVATHESNIFRAYVLLRDKSKMASSEIANACGIPAILYRNSCF